jgi:hypothetical protein
MDPTFPKDIKLYDQISNLERLLVCSPKLRDFIQSLELPSVETLPVTIFDHKGKVASDEYSIINPYSVQDCIDQQASMFDWNPIDTDLICGMYELVLDHEKIDPAIPVFRPKHFAQFTFIREDIADAIVKQGFQGPVMSSFDGWAR